MVASYAHGIFKFTQTTECIINICILTGSPGTPGLPILPGRPWKQRNIIIITSVYYCQINARCALKNTGIGLASLYLCLVICRGKGTDSQAMSSGVYHCQWVCSRIVVVRTPITLRPLQHNWGLFTATFGTWSVYTISIIWTPSGHNDHRRIPDK